MLDNWTNAVMNLMPLIGVICTLVVAWRIAHGRESNSARRTMDVCGLLLLVIAAFAGERWYSHYHTQPFFLGFGHVFEGHDNMNPVIFMVVIGIILTYAGKLLFHRIAIWWSKHESWGTIGPKGVSFMFLMLWMLVFLNIGAHNMRVNGETPARSIVASSTRTVADAFKTVSNGLADLSKQVEESKSN